MYDHFIPSLLQSNVPGLTTTFPPPSTTVHKNSMHLNPTLQIVVAYLYKSLTFPLLLPRSKPLFDPYSLHSLVGKHALPARPSRAAFNLPI